MRAIFQGVQTMKKYELFLPVEGRCSVWIRLLVLLMTVAACTHHLAPSVTESGLRYSPITIASGVPAKPGTLAWSPDGERLAFLGKTLIVYDMAAGKPQSLSIDNPYYVAWASDNTLYILSRNRTGNTMLYSLDKKISVIQSMALDQDADALYPAADGKSLIILSTKMKSLPFGTTISTIVMVRTLAANNAKTVYSFNNTSVIKNPDVALWTAWTNAGLNPLDDAVLVMEHLKPPVDISYTRVKMVDLATGGISEISDPNTRRSYLSASWSPDGKRVVMTDINGRLEIRNRLGAGTVLDWSFSAVYPSWNPQGSRIYAGGYLIDSDGKNRELLITNAAGSFSQWSPDGTRLAVVTNGDLLLFRNIPASYIPPDKPFDRSLAQKLLLLKDLVGKGVLSPQEYNEQRHKLIDEKGL
jgi:hypothetical protein